MKIHTLIFLFLFLIFVTPLQELFSEPVNVVVDQGLVTSIIKIDLPEYPDAHNPSLIDTNQGLLLTFRWLPNHLTPWVSYIGAVFLNESLQPISKPQLLDTRLGNRSVPSQSEDARIFYHQGNLYVIYNDNSSYVNPTLMQRRDMYIAQLFYIEGQFILSEPVKLYHQQKYFAQKWQKNWAPFEWHNALLLSYSLIPHEVLSADIISGECVPFISAPFANTIWEWKWGFLRGGTPATLIDINDEHINKEYLAFFHSSIITSSEASNEISMYHYYMGAYTFSDEPPFEITKVTPSPIMADGFYTKSSSPKRVIFPGGFVMRDKHFYLAYGKDDQEMWIATIHRQNLIKALIPVPLLK